MSALNEEVVNFRNGSTKLTGLATANARQMNPRQLSDLCNAANGECVPQTVVFGPSHRTGESHCATGQQARDEMARNGSSTIQTCDTDLPIALIAERAGF